MGPKKKKGGKKGAVKKAPVDKPKEYQLITLEEFRIREAKHNALLADLRTVLHFLEDAFIEVKKYENERRIQDKWDKYVLCDGLPKPYSPPDVRLFFVMLRHFENKNVTKTIDWLLSVDERSILSQDIFRKDRTSKTLVKEIRPNIGLEYDKNIELALKVLKDIEYFLDDTSIVEMIPERILDDIIEQKTSVHQEIEQFFDRFAYRILCSEDAYMNQIDAITAEYCYEAKNFEIQIWTLKNVPIIFDFVEAPSIIASFHTLNIDLQIPFSLLQENLTIRGIHMNFDHFSEYAKSFEQKIDAPVDQLHAGITVIVEDTNKERIEPICLMDEKCFISKSIRHVPKSIHLRFKLYTNRNDLKNWFNEFNRGRRSLKGEFREGRPKTAVVPEIIDAVRELIMQDRHVTYREIEASLGIFPTSIHSILHEQLALKKWAMQIQIMQEVRNNMIKTRFEYEEKQRQIAEESGKKEKERKAADAGKPAATKKKGPAKKGKAEPPIISDDSYPDVWDDFIEKDFKHNEDFLNAVFHPTVLRLTEQEINLKKYMILGGVYQLYVVTKPNHTGFNSFNMTWHANNGNLHVDKDIIADMFAQHKDTSKRLTITASKHRKRSELRESKSVKKSQADIMEQISRLGGPRKEEVIPETKSRFGSMRFLESDEKYTKDPELSPLFIITFELPSYLCLWGEPIPCHFEADIIGLVETFEVRLPSFLLGNPDGDLSMSTAPSDGGESTSVVSSVPTTPREPRDPLLVAGHPSTIFNVFKSMSTFSLRRGQSGTVRELPAVEDFNLNFPMTKQQIRKLQRYCVPLMLTSYRFPVEIAEEESEENKFKPKGEAGTLVRKRLSGSDDQMGKNMDRVFGFNSQNNPERIFPVFMKKDTLFTPPRNEDFQLLLGQMEPETFYELIQNLDFIKKKYKTSYRLIADVPQIIQKYHTPHHRKLGSQSAARIKRPTASLQPRRSLVMATSKVTMDDKDDKGKSVEEKEIKDARGSRKASKTTPRQSAAAKKRASSLSKKKQKLKDKQKEVPEEKPIETKLEKYSHWTRAHIFHSIYDKESRKITIWTDRLGSLGFAYKRYVHFPFLYWSVEPSPENPETEIAVTIDTQHARCIIYVTAEGYRGRATEITLKYKKNIEIYLEIPEPIKDLKELKKRFRDRNVNIFSEHDARFYIENGYFSEKHLSTELHSYTCMAIHGSSMRFVFSDWNRLATRRDIILRFAHYKEPDEQLALTRITPEGATFVEVKELCTDNLDEFKLDYTLTWRNIDFYADLHHCVTSMYAASTESRVKNANLITNLKNLLFEIRPISYS